MNHDVRFAQAPRVLSRSFAGEVLLARVEREDVVRLEGTAAAVWDLLEAPRTVPQLVDMLAGVYEAPANVIEADVEGLVVRLVREGWAEEVALNDG